MSYAFDEPIYNDMGAEDDGLSPCSRCHQWETCDEDGLCSGCVRQAELVALVRERRRKQYRELRGIGYSREWAKAYVLGEPPPDDPPMFDFSPRATKLRAMAEASDVAF